MSNYLWNRYMNPQLKPEEYKAQGGDLAKRLNGDLTELWGNHPSSASLKPGEITAISTNLANWLRTGRTSALKALDKKVRSEEDIALDAWIMENKNRRSRRRGW